MSVDILVGGREAVGALKLAPLADATGGVILLLEDFGESFFENLSAAVRRPVSDGAILKAIRFKIKDCQNLVVKVYFQNQ